VTKINMMFSSSVCCNGVISSQSENKVLHNPLPPNIYVVPHR
jgi:hypothetical protein